MVEKSRKVLQVSGLRVKVKSEQGMLSLVEDIHFDIERGQVLGLVGESGSGKSVTCNSLLQLLDPKHTTVEGSILLNGRELNGLKAEDMRRIRGKEMSFIMQNPMNAFTRCIRLAFLSLKRFARIPPLRKNKLQSWQSPRWRR